MKRCPYCAEEIQDNAIFCRYCAHDTRVPVPPPPDQSTPVENSKYIICLNCGNRQLVGLARCTNCLSPLIVNDKPGQPLQAQPVVSSKPVAPTSLEAPPTKTISPPLSVWRVAMIPAVVFTGLAAIASIYQYYKYPAELMGSLLIGIPASFIFWWLIFIFFIYILRKTEGKKWARVGAILVIIIFFCILFYFGASQAGGGTFFAPTATPTRTPRPTPTKKVMPICHNYLSTGLNCKPGVELTLDTCNFDNGHLIIKGSVKNVGTTTIKNLLIIGLLCPKKNSCIPISYPPGYPTPFIETYANAQTDWYSIYDLRPRKIEAFTLEAVLPPNTSYYYCKVDYYIP